MIKHADPCSSQPRPQAVAFSHLLLRGTEPSAAEAAIVRVEPLLQTALCRTKPLTADRMVLHPVADAFEQRVRRRTTTLPAAGPGSYNELP